MHFNAILHTLNQNQIALIDEIAQNIKTTQGTEKLYVVGGFIRDAVDGQIRNHSHQINNIDIEIFGISFKRLTHVISKIINIHADHNKRKITIPGALSLSITIPRKDIFEDGNYRYLYNPNFTIEQAARRRDCTINALYFDWDTKKLIDLYGGIADIEEGVVKAININHFSRDPKRFLRAFRIASKLNFRIDSKIRKKKINFELETIDNDFFSTEITKALSQNPYPSEYFILLNNHHREWFAMDAELQEFLFIVAENQIALEDLLRIQKKLRIPNGLNHNFQLKRKNDALRRNGFDYAEIDKFIAYFKSCHPSIILKLLGLTIGVPQSPISHPEGDVWTHSLLSTDVAARLYPQYSTPLVLLYTMLLHDVGKSFTSKYRDENHIVTTDHETAGGIICSYVLKNTTPANIYHKVLAGIEIHMYATKLKKAKNPKQFYNNEFSHIRLKDLSLIHHCDLMGRGTFDYLSYLTETHELFKNQINKEYPMFWISNRETTPTN